MADDFVDMEMSFLRRSASEHVVTEQGEEIATALDEIAEEDTDSFQYFVQARFNTFFQENVTPQMKRMMSVQNWQSMYARSECQATVQCFLQ